jgi:hypothetical protein
LAVGPVPTADRCALIGAGIGVEKSTNAAATWSNGVDLQSVIGLSVSSTTGWFRQSKISFYFNTHGPLWGTNAYPPDAERVVGKA